MYFCVVTRIIVDFVASRARAILQHLPLAPGTSSSCMLTLYTSCCPTGYSETCYSSGFYSVHTHHRDKVQYQRGKNRWTVGCILLSSSSWRPGDGRAKSDTNAKLEYRERESRSGFCGCESSIHPCWKVSGPRHMKDINTEHYAGALTWCSAISW